MSFRLHGNYCGPGWSAGAWQDSVVSDVPAMDAFDQTCRDHDAAYATNVDRADADARFAYDNITSLDPIRVGAGLGVGIQGIARRIGLLSRGRENINQVITPSRVNVLNMPKRNIRRKMDLVSKNYELSHPTPRVSEADAKALAAELQALKAELRDKLRGGQRFAGRIGKGLTRAFAPTRVAAAPVSIGTSIGSSKPFTRSTSNGVVVTGREFLLPVTQINNTNWQVGALAPLHPAYYPASTMGTMARAYQYYRFSSIVVHFVTKEPTSTNGEVLLTYSPNVLEPVEDGSGAQFLARSMTRATSTLGPIWQNHSMSIPCDNVFRKVDAFNASTYNDNVAGEVQVFTLAGSADTSGYMLIDYQLEFKDAMYTPHSSSIPLSTGPGLNYTVTQATAAINGAVIVSNANMGVAQPGTIWRFVCDIDQSSITGATFANAFQFTNQYGSSTTAVTYGTRPAVLKDGTALYLVHIGSNNFTVYTSYEAAVNGDGSGQIFAISAFTALSIVGNAYIARFSGVELITAD